MTPFASEFFQWADVLGVDEDDALIVLDFLGRTESLPPEEQVAIEFVLNEIGGPMMAARIVEATEGPYLEWFVNQRKDALLPAIRASLRERELVEMPYREYLRTPEWAERAADARQRFGHRCAVCNADGELHAHHRTYERRGREETEDLTALCPGCHALFHEWRDLTVRV